MAASRQHVVCGLDCHCVTDLTEGIKASTYAGYQFIAAPIVHPRYRQEFIHGKAKGRSAPFARSDLLLSSQDWSSMVFGKISSWIDVDSDITETRRASEMALEQELNYALHLGLPAILLPLQGPDCVNLAHIISNRLVTTAGYQLALNIWVQVPMQAPSDQCRIFVGGPASAMGDSSHEDENLEDTWEWWNLFRSLCNTEKKLGLALELSADLPSMSELSRWLSEPVRCLIVPTSLFLTNKKGYPVLSRAHQYVVHKFYALDVQVLVRGVNRHGHIKYYKQYMDHLWMTQPPPDAVSSFARGYEDYLQVPLQPLMDNLESCTYEVFEKDPVKYTEYQKAMYQAIVDKMSSAKDTKEIVLMVVGAGRGPLVRAALIAAEKADCKVKVYAVEKNPNAVVTLQTQRDELWGDRVTVVSCDMREWDPPEKADILVSELLGSFGDNELSPECLDGAQKFLADDGISIPCSYTSHVVPIQSHKLYSEVAQLKEKDKHPLTPYEMPYVVHLHNCMEISTTQSLFTFHHPNRDIVIDNTRYKKVVFDIPQAQTLHGFAGYFTTVLYKDITLSTLPSTHSPGMFSWFPIYFPIKDPISLPSGSRVELHFWRRINRHNVWYEWCVTKPVVSSIHNPNGRSYTIGL